MAGFQAAVQAFAYRAKKRVDETERRLLVKLAAKIIDRTPFGAPETWKRPAPPWYEPGTARAGWQYSNNLDGASGYARWGDLPRDPIASITVEIDARRGRKHYITNDVPYIMELERGWSRQAPAGMVGITLVEYQSLVREAAAEAREVVQ